MEPEKYSNNTKTTVCDVRRLYHGEQIFMHVFNTVETLESARGRRRRDPVTRFQNPKLNPETKTTTMSNVNAAPLEKRTEVERLLPAESVSWIWAQVNQFCDAKTETRNSVNPHNNSNLRWLTFRAE